MSALSLRSHNVSFSDNVDSEVDTHVGSSSSPMAGRDALVPSSSSPTRGAIMPLAALKTIPLSRRGVVFSPRLDTKYFHTDDLILPSPTKVHTPLVQSSVRSFSDPVTPQDSPSKGKGRAHSSPALVRSILKARAAQQIRLAASVEEGTLNNKEAARLLVSGKRPKLLARDSFQLAILRNAAGDGGDRKGKGKMTDQMTVPGSDGSTTSSSSGPGGPERGVNGEPGQDQDAESDEEEEQVEEDGALATGSLLNIILDGPEDLLTLEEAYNTLTLRLRQRIPVDSEPLSPGMQDDIRLYTQPLRDEAPAMVRAIQRDLQRLLGKLPHSATSFGSSDGDSPFRDLRPLPDRTPTNARGRFTPSPTPDAGVRSSSPTRAARQGYTESEVRYRREASGVGAAVLRFLALTFHTPCLFTCYTEADLTSLLEKVMIIPRTPKLPTPNPKRTYYLSILVLGQMNLPSASVQPVKDKIVRALEGAMADNLGAMGGAVSGKEGPSATKKEGYSAVTNLVSNYPSIFFPHFSDLLAGCLRGMASSSNIIRYKAGAATCAFARARFAYLANTQSALMNDGDAAARDAWTKAKSVIQKSEFFVVSHLKSALKVPGKSTSIYGKDGEKKTEWHALEQVFKDTVGSTTDVHWACAGWSVVITLMGSAYASSGLASGFDHIIDRSLQPSTNTVRPLLARVAWNHAIHAYLSSGFATSVTPEGHLIRSYKPFAASSQQTAEQRTATIQLAVDLALSRATDKASYARALVLAKAEVEAHYVWQRSEKAKKFQWLVTCGLGATDVVYAHTGMAVCHEDQSAKEMSTMTGLPSSDGVPVPDMSPEESRLPRLDNSWEKVVYPILQSSFAIRGVDRLTTQSWAIFDAITSPSTASHSTWNLERLLVPRYMSGEVFAREKDADVAELMEDIQAGEIQASDIPSYGPFWVAKRLGRLLALFDEALTSIYGLNDSSSVGWIKTTNGTRLIPTPLSNVWSNLLNALKSIQIARAPPTPLYLAGLHAVTKQLLQMFTRDPKSYVPISQIDSNGACRMNEDELRIGITAHLFDIALSVLGEDALGHVRLRLDQIPGQTPDTNAAISQLAFGADTNGYPTVAGILLGQVLRSKPPSMPLQPVIQTTFRELVEKVLDVASAPGYAGKLLGDITNAMPFLFEDCEEMQLDVWRTLALKWTEVIDLQPSSGVSSTNHTGALLVSLLSGPFRGRQVTSSWHRDADQVDLEIWRALLKVTILRFRAKRVGSNFGVLEALAAHLSDFLGEAVKTSSTTITLSCLAAATSWISFPPSSQSPSQASPWQIDENYVPVDFLALVNSALEEAYPSPESQTSTQTQSDTPVVVSPAVEEVLSALKRVLEDTPVELFGQVLEPVKSSLARWLEDPERFATDMSMKLDEIYVTVLGCLGNAIASSHIPANSDTLNTLVELYAPRLSRAESSAVPLAFQQFWDKSFARVDGLEYSDDVAGFLRDLLVAVPGMIVAPGLQGESPLSEEESLARYPHIDSARPAPLPTATEMEIDPVSTMAEYDADVSQSIEQTQPQPPAEIETDILVDETRNHISPPSSPRISEAESERYVSDEASFLDEDVFGPASLTRAQPAKAKGKGKAKAAKRRVGKKGKRAAPVAPVAEAAKLESPQLSIRAKVEVPEPAAEDSFATHANDSEDDCIILQPSPGFYQRRGLPQPTQGAELADGGKAEVETAAPLSTTAPVINEEELAPNAATLLDAQPRSSSILTSASRWLSRVPSFPFFSPSSNVEAPPASQRDPTTKSPSGTSGTTDVVGLPSVPAPAPASTQPSKRKAPRSKKRHASNPASVAISPAAVPADAEPAKTVPPPAVAAALVATSSAESVVSSVSTSTRSKRKAPIDVVPESVSVSVSMEAEADAAGSDEPRRSKRRRSKAPTEDVDVMPPVTVAVAGRAHDTPVPKTRTAEPIDVLDEDEDELLLSPESARRRKREEEEEVRASQARVGLTKTEPQGQSQWSESISGRFDDAPGDSSFVQSLGRRSQSSLSRPPSPPTSSAARVRTRSAKGKGKGKSVPSESEAEPSSPKSELDADADGQARPLPTTSPAKRSSQQTRVLQMLDEAAQAKEVIDNMDYQGVKALLKNLNELREAAEGRMMARLEELRRGL